MTPFLALPRKHVPVRLAIFVAQLGRKFCLFSLTMQMYENFKVLPNYFSKAHKKHARKTHPHASQISDLSFYFATPYIGSF